MLDVTYTRDDGTRKQDENVLVEVGADANHKDLNETLVGMAPGESKTVKIAYDADTAAEGLAGRTVEYALALKAVKTKVVPAADDEFAKDLGEFDSLQELKDKLRRQLLAADERRDRARDPGRPGRRPGRAGVASRSRTPWWSATWPRGRAAPPRGWPCRAIDPRKAGLDWKQFHDAQREAAVRAAKADILLDEIARREGIRWATRRSRRRSRASRSG